MHGDKRAMALLPQNHANERAYGFCCSRARVHAPVLRKHYMHDMNECSRIRVNRTRKKPVMQMHEHLTAVE